MNEPRSCDNCKIDLENPFFCRECKKIQVLEELPDYFSTLNVGLSFDLEPSKLQSQYEDFLMDIHPDFFQVHEAEHKSLSLKYSSHLKSARDGLSTPFERAMHLLSVGYGKTPDEKELMPSQDFLLEMFDIQEKIESGASDIENNLQTLKLIDNNLQELNALFNSDFNGDDENHYNKVTNLLGRLKFLQNLKEKIESST